jgi:hypothetical protein
MDKKIVRQNIIKTVLFLAAVSLIIWAYFSNVDYNLSHGLDALSGATQAYE